MTPQESVWDAASVEGSAAPFVDDKPQVEGAADPALLVTEAPATNPDITRDRPNFPTVFMQVLRPHTYHGRPQDEGDVYLAHEHEVENIENLKFAKRIPPPPRLRCSR
jgi:hypothetical protein